MRSKPVSSLYSIQCIVSDNLSPYHHCWRHLAFIITTPSSSYSSSLNQYNLVYIFQRCVCPCIRVHQLFKSCGQFETFLPGKGCQVVDVPKVSRKWNKDDFDLDEISLWSPQWPMSRWMEDCRPQLMPDHSASCRSGDPVCHQSFPPSIFVSETTLTIDESCRIFVFFSILGRPWKATSWLTLHWRKVWYMLLEEHD